MADDAEYIRQLIEESKALPPMTRREALSYGEGAFGGLGRVWERQKTPDRIDEDRRAAYVLQRLNERYQGAALRGVDVPEEYRDWIGSLADAADLYHKNPALWNSRYESSTGSHPIYNAATWAQSLPSAIYSVGNTAGNATHRALTNEDVPHPDAAGDLFYAANTLLGGALSMQDSYWRDVEDTRLKQQRQPRVGFFPKGIRDQAIANTQHGANRHLIEGDQFLRDNGVSSSAARWLGPAMDAAIDLPSSFGGYLKLARQGKGLRALGTMASDYAKSGVGPLAETAEKLSQGKLPWEN